MLGLLVNQVTQGLDVLIPTLNRTSFAIILVLILRYFPLAYLILWYAKEQDESQLYDAAHLVTCQRWDLAKWVYWPLNKGYIMVTGFIIFFLSFGELGASLMVVAPGKSTTTITLYNYLHYGDMVLIGGLVASLMIVMILTGIGGYLWLKKREKRGGSFFMDLF
jgi:iron(III) transport system permease protein